MSTNSYCEWVKADMNNLPEKNPIKLHLCRYVAIPDEPMMLGRDGIIQKIEAAYEVEWLKPIENPTLLAGDWKEDFRKWYDGKVEEGGNYEPTPPAANEIIEWIEQRLLLNNTPGNEKQ